MLRRDRQIRMQIHKAVDGCLFALGFWVAYQLRANESIIQMLHLDQVTSIHSYIWLILLLVPASWLVLEAQGFYARPLIASRYTTSWQLLKACIIIGTGLVLTIFVFRLYPIARWVVVWFACVSFVLVFAKEELLRVVFKSKVAQAQYRRRFILVGEPDETGRIRDELKERRVEGMEVLSELDLNRISVDDLVRVLHEQSVNGVILSARHTYFEQVELAIRACELEGVEAWLVADFFKTQISRTSFDDLYGQPVMVFRSTPDMSWQSVLKQMIDLLGATVLLILFCIVIPVIPLAALLIRLTSPGPILFRQQRSGLNGRPFTIYKFRTMTTDAEQRQHELAAMNEMEGPVFKMTEDPRITRVGKVLRKFSIDEFPQLINVLRGEMSLVGPRPLPVDEVKRFNDLAHRRRLSVKPGLTCLWQISGRNNVKDFKDWVRLDLEYIDNWSLWLDLKILWRTLPVVLAGTGAK